MSDQLAASKRIEEAVQKFGWGSPEVRKAMQDYFNCPLSADEETAYTPFQPGKYAENAYFTDRFGKGTECSILFPHGYRASIIKGPGTYGGRYDLFEYALLTSNSKFVTRKIHPEADDDVIPCCTQQDVMKLLNEAEKWIKSKHDR